MPSMLRSAFLSAVQKPYHRDNPARRAGALKHRHLCASSSMTFGWRSKVKDTGVMSQMKCSGNETSSS